MELKKCLTQGDKRGNIHLHKWYASTSCPGPYVESLMPEYARRINEGLKPKPTPKPEGDKMYKIQIGAYSVKANADKALKEAIAKGYKDAYIVETGSVTKPSDPFQTNQGHTKKYNYPKFILVLIYPGLKSRAWSKTWDFNQRCG